MSDATDQHETADIAVVGAGAAGLAAGIFAAEADVELHGRRTLRIVLLDGAVKVGAKILVSGGGRCNVTHETVTAADFNGPRNIVRNVLTAFDHRTTVEWFESMGVRLKREPTGKLFPVSDDAHTVLDALLDRCAALDVAVRSGHRVHRITRRDDPFDIEHERGVLAARRLIIATGGRSLPKTGSDGGGYAIVKSLGHTVSETYAALVPLVLDDAFFHANLSGLSQTTQLTTFADGKKIDRRTGSMLWTHFGVSGPVAMDASRFWVIAHASGQNVALRASFFPGESFEKIEGRLIDAGKSKPSRWLVNLLADSLPRRLAEAIVAHCGIARQMEMAQLSRESRRRLVHALSDLPLPVVRDRGWNYAEVTAGGVPLSEIDYRSMRSRRSPGLYLIGEILDCDGRIGGFNFQWAWSSGYLAGRDAARSL